MSECPFFAADLAARRHKSWPRPTFSEAIESLHWFADMRGRYHELDYLACERYAREGLALMREIGSVKGILHALFELAEMVLLKGEMEEARALAEEMAALAEESNNLDSKRLSVGLLAFLLCVMDEAYPEGVALARQQQTFAQELLYGARHEPSKHWGRAIADCGLGKSAAARQRYPGLFRERRGDPGPATICLALEAVARAREGRAEAAASFLGLAFQQPAWANGWLHRWPKMSRMSADLSCQLGDEAYQAAWKRGATLDLESTIRSILGEVNDTPRKSANDALIEPLTQRELAVLRLLMRGLSNAEIARELIIAVGTVKRHVNSIYSKLGVRNRAQAITRAQALLVL